MESNSSLDNIHQKVEKKLWTKNTNLLSILVPVYLSLVFVVYIHFSVNQLNNIDYAKIVIPLSIFMSVLSSLIYSKGNLRKYNDCLYISLISLIISSISAYILFIIIDFIRILINVGFDMSLLMMYPIKAVYIFIFTLYIVVIASIPAVIGSLIGFLIQKRYSNNIFESMKKHN